MGVNLLESLLLYEALFKISEPCSLYHTNLECQYFQILVTTGNCGLVLIQIAMSIDRFLCLVWTSGCSSTIAMILGGSAFTASFSLFFFLTQNDPMNNYVSNCGYYPTASYSNFEFMLSVLFYITLANIPIDLALLRLSFWREKRILRSFIMQERFETRSSLKSTQAMFILSICQFSFMASYSGITWFLLQVQVYMTSFQYSVILSLVYATPYACLTLPLVLCAILRFIKNQRNRSITSLTNHRETHEEHMQKITKIWN
ncbi:unnamed protein product [Caenorhabditis angaria]|uniref:Uncharacterized protein n=1 Tax=Caenorhabditis angaria TaxID=860376 RepID=A0A9P1IDX3_9PELO|nr:unnamed protein product [Caenorhabditis angaria]